jgi:hypothetical protein
MESLSHTQNPIVTASPKERTSVISTEQTVGVVLNQSCVVVRAVFAIRAEVLGKSEVINCEHCLCSRCALQIHGIKGFIYFVEGNRSASCVDACEDISADEFRNQHSRVGHDAGPPQGFNERVASECVPSDRMGCVVP